MHTAWIQAPQGFEWGVILIVVLLLFGAKRLPDAARGLGRSLRILKAETKGLHDDTDDTDDDEEPAAIAAPVVTPVTAKPEVSIAEVNVTDAKPVVVEATKTQTPSA